MSRSIGEDQFGLVVVQLKIVSKMVSITNICNAVLDYVPIV